MHRSWSFDVLVLSLRAHSSSGTVPPGLAALGGGGDMITVLDHLILRSLTIEGVRTDKEISGFLLYHGVVLLGAMTSTPLHARADTL